MTAGVSVNANKRLHIGTRARTEYGEYKLMVQPEGQDAGEDVGKYVVLWKKTPEGWKLHWDIFNTDLPAP